MRDPLKFALPVAAGEEQESTMDEVEQFEHQGFTCRILYDTDPAIDPRNDYDHAGVMLFSSKVRSQYDVGDDIVQNYAGFADDPWTVECPRCRGLCTFDTSERVGGFTVTRDCGRCEGEGFLRVEPSEWAKREQDAPISIALYIGDGHGPFYEFYETDDRDRANGIAFLTAETIRKEWGKGPAVFKAARAYLHAEVEEYEHYLAGRVYGFQVEDAEGEHVDSCWGFIGELDYARSQARESAADAAEERDTEARRAAYWAARDVETAGV